MFISRVAINDRALNFWLYFQIVLFYIAQTRFLLFMFFILYFNICIFSVLIPVITIISYPNIHMYNILYYMYIIYIYTCVYVCLFVNKFSGTKCLSALGMEINNFLDI